MRRPLALTALLLAAALTPASPAAAKALVGVSLCGAAGCVDRSSEIGHQPPDGGLLNVGATSIADPGRVPFLRVHLHIGADGKEFGQSTMLLAPGIGAVRTEDGTWYRLPADLARQWRHLARHVTPLPARELTPFEPPPSPPVPESPSRAPRPAAAHRSGASDGGGPPAGLVAGGVVLVLLAGAGGAAAWLARRRPPGEASPTG